MRSLEIYNLLAHHEEGPGVRHPLVVGFHIPYAIALFLVYVFFSKHTLGQSIYFIVVIGLYGSSAAYHAWRPEKLLRFADQTMISWFVLATPMPFIYQESWALPYFLTMCTLTAVCKWQNWEKDDTVGALVFFGLGAFSALLMLTAGMPNIGATTWSYEGLVLFLAIACFIGKLLIYHFQWHLFPDIWEAPESGHFVLSCGVTIYTILVVQYPV